MFGCMRDFITFMLHTEHFEMGYCLHTHTHIYIVSTTSNSARRSHIKSIAKC